jgi:SAM-dependent methyltransferase
MTNLQTPSFVKGLKPKTILRSLLGGPSFGRDFFRLKRQRGNDSSFPFGPLNPVTFERHEESGTMSGHYFHQDLLVARKVYLANPNKHVDIGSRTDGFVAHVAVFREIEILDIRAQHSKVKNIHFRQADLMQLQESMRGYCDSISSLHAIEHFGLGRYGDPIDYAGHTKAIENITQLLQPGGTFYFSVPIGPQRIEFNAHRVFSVDYLLKLLAKNYDVCSFSYVDDSGDLWEDIALKAQDVTENFGCRYGCGIFELKKKR